MYSECASHNGHDLMHLKKQDYFSLFRKKINPLISWNYAPIPAMKSNSLDTNENTTKKKKKKLKFMHFDNLCQFLCSFRVEKP